MTVTLTRAEVRAIIEEMNTLRGNYPALGELYIEIGGELDAVEKVEATLRAEQENAKENYYEC